MSELIERDRHAAGGEAFRWDSLLRRSLDCLSRSFSKRQRLLLLKHPRWRGLFDGRAQARAGFRLHLSPINLGLGGPLPFYELGGIE